MFLKRCCFSYRAKCRKSKHWKREGAKHGAWSLGGSELRMTELRRIYRMENAGRNASRNRWDTFQKCVPPKPVVRNETAGGGSRASGLVCSTIGYRPS